MDAEHTVLVSSLVLLAFSLCYTPGPNNTLAISTGLERGVKAALPLALGSAIGANVSLLGLGYGLNEVFRLYPQLLDGLRFAGALYLLWLAWKISGLRFPLRGKALFDLGAVRGKRALGTSSKSLDVAQEKSNNAFKPLGFFQAAILQLVNVKVWITNLIIVTNYVEATEGWEIRLYGIALLFTVVGASAPMAWAALGALMRRFLTRENIRRANYVFALVLVVSVGLLFA